METFKSTVEIFSIFYSPGKNELLRFPTCVRPDGSLVAEIPRSSLKSCINFLSFVYFNRADAADPPPQIKRNVGGAQTFLCIAKTSMVSHMM